MLNSKIRPRAVVGAALKFFIPVLRITSPDRLEEGVVFICIFRIAKDDGICLLFNQQGDQGSNICLSFASGVDTVPNENLTTVSGYY